MSAPFRISLLGFSAFERSAMVSYFRMATNREPRYEPVDDTADAHYVVVDADDTDAVRQVVISGRAADAVFVGALAPTGASAWVMRPIDPLHVLRELDAMVGSHASAQLAGRHHLGLPTPQPGRVTTIIKPPPGAHGRRNGDADNPPSGFGGFRSSGLMPLPDFADLDIPFPTAPPGPAPAEPAPQRRRAAPAPTAAEATPVLPATPQPDRGQRKPSRRPLPPPRGQLCLLVDDSEIALRYLESRLQAQGMQTETAMSSGKAIELLAHKAYDFVFLDVDLGEDSELDGLSLCQHIKRQHRHVGGHREPVVVLVSAHHSQMDRVRGTLAGAEAYLGKPLDETALARLLHQHGITLLHPPAVLTSPKAREPEAR